MEKLSHKSKDTETKGKKAKGKQKKRSIHEEREPPREMISKTTFLQ